MASRVNLLRGGVASIMLALLGGCAAVSDPASGDPITAGPSTMYVMRHLNTVEGDPDPELTAAGRQSAETLVGWFQGKPLGAVYVSDFRRTRQTAAPLAVARGLAAKLYDPADTPALIRRVRAEGAPVLIVGHSNTVPDIVEQLGGIRPLPMTHPDFSDVWMVGPDETVRSRIL